MKTRRAMLVALIVCVAMLSFAIGASPAAAISTSSLYAKLKALQKQVTALAYKVAHMPSGAVGATGATGPAGANGAAGSVGATGPAGLNGAMGPAGSQGPTGPAGPKGDVGDPGPAGPAGSQGATGPAGPAADAGFWPIDSLETSVALSAYTDTYGPSGNESTDRYFQVTVLVKPSGPDFPADDRSTAYLPPTDCVMKVTYDGHTYYLGNNALFTVESSASPGSLLYPLPSTPGTPVSVEYWVEKSGIRRHGTVIITDWSWGPGPFVQP